MSEVQKKKYYFANSLIICTFATRFGGGQQPPSFIHIHNEMIDKGFIIQIVEEYLKDSNCYLVDTSVNPGNGIIVEIDSDEAVSIDECVKLNRFIESKLDRDEEDFELEVGSSGLSSSFKILKQYQKNIGNEVEVLTKNGLKLHGTLKNADENRFIVTITKKVRPEGAKRKIDVEEDLQFSYDEVKYTKYLIRFK